MRVFLDWNKPLLEIAADYFVERYFNGTHFDMRNAVLVLPGARAKDRLEEILAERAEKIDSAWYPPEILTIGQVPEKFYEQEKDFADEMTQCFAWIHAVDQLGAEDPARLHQLLPHSYSDIRTRWSLGQQLAQLHTELAAEIVDFGTVAEKVPQEKARWETLAVLQKKYLALLDSLNLWDKQSARLYAIQNQDDAELQRIKQKFHENKTEFFLVGVADMNREQKEIFSKFPQFITPLIFAPNKLADHFDEYGALLPEQWQDAHIDLTDEQIIFVNKPAEQAAAVVDLLEMNPSQLSTVIGVPDAQVIPPLEQQFESADLKTRLVAGKSIKQTPVYRFLEILPAYNVHTPTFVSVAELVRHPDVEAFLHSGADVLTMLDNYHTYQLPVAFEPQSPVLLHIQEKLQELTASQNLRKILQTLFGKKTAPVYAVPLEKTYAVLDALENVPKAIHPTLSLADTLNCVLLALENERIPPHQDTEAVELLGWLELSMDDAPAVIVTGMNDGKVPEFKTADVFLPDKLRQMLHIEDNKKRYARDAYAASCILAVRGGENVVFIAGRTSAEGDPLLPSRLFFAAENETVVQRVQRFFDAKAMSKRIAVHAGRQKERNVFVRPQVPIGYGSTITAMNVTDFAKYKRCPYRFYLEHIGLKTLNDDGTELNAAGFGSLIHKVLDKFGKNEISGSLDSGVIGQFLEQELEQQLQAQYGTKLCPAVEIQAASAKERLRAFARWQAEWGREYEIVETEMTFDETKKCTLDFGGGENMMLHGRIDRIDRERSTRKLFIFDYKTGSIGADPNKTHCQKGAWVDFQLPLYAHLLRQTEKYKESIEKNYGTGYELGYVVLPSDANGSGKKLAKWSQDDIDEALEGARQIVQNIRDGQFEPAPLPFASPFDMICSMESRRRETGLNP